MNLNQGCTEIKILACKKDQDALGRKKQQRKCFVVIFCDFYYDYKKCL